MIYVMSDLHGCYEEFKQALELIQFSQEDTMYLLGDVIDRGPDSILLLQGLMMYDNIIPLIGNHEVMAMSLLPKLCTEITEDSYNTTIDEDDLISLDYWMQDGRKMTLDQFQRLDRWDMDMILDYLNEFRLIEEVCISNQNYVLMHAGVPDMLNRSDLSHLRIEDCVFQTTPYWIQDSILVCGHTPTKSHLIEFDEHKISIDCGCVFGGALGILRLDDMKAFYVQHNN